jgi:hypothetical protein
MNFDADKFISTYSGLTESHYFYNKEIELKYDVEAHQYFRLEADEFILVPSVTGIIHILDKSNALINWACRVMEDKLLDSVPLTDDKRVNLSFEEFAKLVSSSKSAHTEILETAGDIGHEAHNLIEQFIKMKLGLPFEFPPSIDQKVSSCYNSALNWMEAHNVRWSNTERKIYSKTYQFAGTLDGICLVDSCNDRLCCKTEFKDRLSLIDWKTSNFLFPEYLLQTAAYKFAFSEETNQILQDRWIIKLPKTDEARFETWHVEDGYEDDLKAFLCCLELTQTMDSIKDRMKLQKDWIKSEVKRAKKEEKTKEKEEERRVKAEIREKVKAEKELLAKEKRKKKKEKKDEGVH